MKNPGRSLAPTVRINWDVFLRMRCVLNTFEARLIVPLLLSPLVLVNYVFPLLTAVVSFLYIVS